MGARIFPVEKGRHTVEVRCRLKAKIFCSASSKESVEVKGDLGQTLRALVRKLGAEKKEERDAAERDLVSAGELATPFLAGATEDPNQEIRMRAKRIFEKRFSAPR